MTIVSHLIKTAPTKISLSSKPLDPIANLHLFGIFDANNANLPITSLPFTLTGTVVSTDSTLPSYALITLPDQKTKILKKGDPLPDGSTLTRITKYFVVLNDHGVLEKLAQNKDQQSST